MGGVKIKNVKKGKFPSRLDPQVKQIFLSFKGAAQVFSIYSIQLGDFCVNSLRIGPE